MRLLIIHIACCCISFSATAQSTLWRIEAPGSTTPAYLFGTVHAYCPSSIRVPDTLSYLVRHTDTLYLELDITDPALILQAAKLSQLPGGQTISQLLSPAEFAALDSLLRPLLGAPLQLLNSFKPILLTSLVALKAFPCPDVLEMERPLAQQAKAAGHVVAALETVEEQMAALDAVPLADQLTMLRQSAEEMESTRAQLAQLIAYYNAGDVTALAALTVDYGAATSQSFADALINRRNQRWATYLAPRLGKSKLLIAVGAGHLGGSQGLITLLRNLGFTVSPITSN